MNKILRLLPCMLLLGLLSATAQYNVPGNYTIEGRLGVGTTSPTGGLEVRSGNGDIIGNALYFYGSGLNPADGLPLARLTERWGIRFSSPDPKWVFSSEQSMLVGYEPNGENWGSGKLFVSNGIGVGTTDFSAKLSVVGGDGGGYAPTIELQNTGTDYAWSLVSLKSNLDNTTDYMIGRANSSLFDGRALSVHVPDRSLYGNSGALPKIAFFSSGGNNLGYIEAETGNWYMKGNVGIGTVNSGGYALAVNGKVRARELKIEVTNWPDYVFLPSYNLRSLSEVEHHIQQHGHLPDVPSASEVEDNGLNIGEANALLLKKIEELTLYLIQQKKELEVQKQKTELLEQKLLLQEKE